MPYWDSGTDRTQSLLMYNNNDEASRMMEMVASCLTFLIDKRISYSPASSIVRCSR